MSEENNIMQEEEISEKAYDSRLMKRLLKFAKKYWYLFLLAVIFLFAATLVDLARPYLMGIAIDDYIKKSNISALNRMGIYFVLLVAAGFVFNLLQIYVLSYAGQYIIYNIRQLVFSHLQKLPLSYFDRNPIGRLVTRITNDTETLNDMYTNVLITLLKDFAILLGAVIIMFRLNSSLTWITLAAMPVVLILTVIFRLRIRKVYRNVRTAIARVNSAISENISGMRIIQLFNKEKPNFERFNKIGKAYYKASMNEVVTFGLFRPVIEMVASLTIALLIWNGGGKVIDNSMEFGVLYALINYISLLFQPINDLAEKYNILQSSMAASERIFMILDTPAEEDAGSLEFDAEAAAGDIEFKNVWFAYNDENWVLKDVSFRVPAGRTIAIVGHTGAGKTSIINLLSRFYEIQRGEILINSINIKDVQKASLRKAIGVVLQDVFLFSGRLNDNIRLNEESITDEKLQEAARYVNADGFISRLPNGYNEEVMERGSTFSSGQRQLLAFARALAFDPAILVLDEATSNIDTETEILIQDALTKLTKNRTTIVIAHRLSTIQHADKIIVLHKGKVHESGTHQELLAAKGMYYSLYQLQYQQQNA
ncbi:ABC transporter ATP-binding protein [Ruminiclostridium cellobioparum]|uniref:ABC transporter n=1 Tax=Ruminiclostridium cellobioparum subsp. termitidis CT1112 TaxID=1195236 RepID=S0FIF8_RUMCE|nr:ABC transporter ATP-binding protein [Ruminiclostridium cellobioparum]EMS69886.1 ABC transporter [Ruminiclostridium cellobioparum subsp. termitidis CT1112]